ncbi:ABC transporter ATP-binding protein [Longirhabdus pacifica]|uniref:ABC transporter ATP-binding protein n=1 Tax=Longirhabdus pacifica TaxID=2305227 RepID=UPI001008E8C8|nr:ABC transporter ATP-binding protein [Longirhabdus pacifica]
MDTILELKHVKKNFKKKEVLKDISFTLHAGEILAITGSNGTGKSTLLRMIAGILTPTEGEIITPKSIKKGFVPDQFPSLRFNAENYLTYMARISGLNEKTTQLKISEWLKLFGLYSVRKQKMEHFSKGMLQKVNMIQGLIEQPDLLILDEPWSGLDVTTLKDWQQVMKQLKKENCTMILTSHQKELLDATADRIIVLEDGKVISDKSNESIRNETNFATIKISKHASSIEKLKKISGVLYVEERNNHIHLVIESNQSNPILSALMKQQYTILSFQNDNDTGNESSIHDNEQYISN